MEGVHNRVEGKALEWSELVGAWKRAEVAKRKRLGEGEDQRKGERLEKEGDIEGKSLQPHTQTFPLVAFAEAYYYN